MAKKRLCALGRRAAGFAQLSITSVPAVASPVCGWAGPTAPPANPGERGRHRIGWGPSRSPPRHGRARHGDGQRRQLQRARKQRRRPCPLRSPASPSPPLAFEEVIGRSSPPIRSLRSWRPARVSRGGARDALPRSAPSTCSYDYAGRLARRHEVVPAVGAYRHVGRPPPPSSTSCRRRGNHSPPPAERAP